MAIARTIIATDGDSLCSIAVQHGFKNCNKLRTANPQFATRHVAPRDRVDVPEITQKEDTGQTELRHRFQRLGTANRIFIVQERNRLSGGEMRGDIQAELAVSNYVPGRQGTGFATTRWRDDNFTSFDVEASADPDHFKLLVFDKAAADRGDAEVKANLQAQQPVLRPNTVEIQRWDNMTEPGTTLPDIVCKRFRAGSPFYRSCYLRLVVDNQDHTAKRRDGFNDPPTAVDGGVDVSKQTLIVPPPADRNLEILDLRVQAFRPAPHCEAGGPTEPQHCKAIAFSDVGKQEKVMRIKAIRVGGAAGSTVTDQQMRDCIFKNLRERYAQMNVGVKPILEPGPGVTIVDNFIHDVSPPTNMIMISDFDGVRARGNSTFQAQVQLTSGPVTATHRIPRNTSPRPITTANFLADALRALGVTCRVSENPPISSSTNDFGSADILCFNADGTMAPLITTSTTDATQTIGDTSTWTNANVQSTSGAYPAPRSGGDAMLAGSPDYRVCAKNFVTGDTYLCAMVVNNLPGLNGEATGPYIGVVQKFRPRPEFRLIVFLSQGGATSPVTLSHEGGHTVLDCFHTTGGNPEADHAGNAYPNNNNLAFSEWMSALPHTNQIRKRISDTPLTVSLRVQRQGAGITGAAGENRLMGGRDTPTGAINQTCAERFRTFVSSLYENLRRLRTPPPQQ